MQRVGAYELYRIYFISISDKDTVVFDTIKAYDWLRARVGSDTDVLVFAHSMGTAIASHALADIQARYENKPTTF